MEFNTILETKEKIISKKISILELNEIFIKRIKENLNLNAFVFFNEELIIKRCKELDNNKDNLAIKGIP